MHHKGMLKLLLVILLTLCLAPQVWAAQTLIKDIYNKDGYYLSTPQKVYTADGWVYKFQADGKTGYPDEIYLPNEQSPSSYRIHSNYTKNTDACASCHSTHTAVGSSLLQWYSNYETCMACHDGTVTTTYNVVEGVIPETAHSAMQFTMGGAFGTGQEKSNSYHNVTGGVLIGSAPGNDLSVGNNNDKPLGCESCHSPHGLGGNARLLNPDPNGVQTRKKLDGKFDDYQLFQVSDPYIDEVAKVVYVAYPKNEDGSFNFNVDPYYMLKGYPYEIKLTIKDQDNNEHQYGQNDGIFEVDNKSGYTKIIVWNVNDISSVSANFIPSLRVRMDIKNYLGIGGQEELSYRDGTSDFCASCHDDYMNDKDSGVYRHPVDVTVSGKIEIDEESPVYTNSMQHKFEPNGKMVCMTCHAAHGVSSEYWQRVLGYSAEDTKELAGSSSLKLAPNSSICEVCHQKGTAGEGYNANTGQPHNNPVYATQDASFVQLVGVENYIGNNATTCGGTNCHTSIVTAWKDTLHSKSFGDENKINPTAKTNWQTGISPDDKIAIDDVVYVVGSKWKQNYVYEAGGVLKVAKGEFVLSSGEWVTRSKENNFVDECAGCHTTGLKVDTGVWADNGVACEACHGTANNHTKVASSANITNPRYLKTADQTDVCAQCHAFGEAHVDEKIYPYPVGYAPNAGALKDTVNNSAYKLANFFTAYSFSDYPGNFYPENPMSNSVHDSAYSPQEFNDFVQSKHYTSGVVSCTTCHSSHKPNGKGQMLKVTFQQTCGSCHGTSFNIDTVMPKRVNITNNPVDNLRVHTFSKQHDKTVIPAGTTKQIH